MSPLDDLWRRLLDGPDPEAATRFVHTAQRHFPSLEEAVRHLHERGLPGIAHGSHRLVDARELEPLRGAVALLGNLELGPALEHDPSALQHLVFISQDLVVAHLPTPQLPPLPSLRVVGQTTTLASNPSLRDLQPLHLIASQRFIAYNNPRLEHLHGLQSLRRCDDLWLLLEPVTELGPESLPHLHPERLMLWRYVQKSPSRWFLRRLATGEPPPLRWLQQATRTDALERHPTEVAMRDDEGAFRDPDEQRRLVALLGCELDGGRAILVCPIYTGRTVIGRQAGADIRLRSSTVARHHFAIRHEAGVSVAVDLGSANGLYQRGQRVERATLKRGDVLHFGRVKAFYWSLETRYHPPPPIPEE